MRDRSIDLIKGIAILFVYLGHGILYHPIQMEAMYDWCRVLGRFIESFNIYSFRIFVFLDKKRHLGFILGKSSETFNPILVYNGGIDRCEAGITFFSFV